jgi:Asp/Glu/Hydantoin racemase
MTVKIGAAARRAAAPGTEIVAVNPVRGPTSIEGYFDEALSLAGLIETVAEHPGADGVDIACFDDTSLDALAARVDVPFALQAPLGLDLVDEPRPCLVPPPPHADQRFVEMGVGLDETGDGNGAAALLHGRVVRCRPRADAGDAAVAHQDVGGLSAPGADVADQEVAGNFGFLGFSASGGQQDPAVGHDVVVGWSVRPAPARRKTNRMPPMAVTRAM